jgi:hypothetical protein
MLSAEWIRAVTVDLKAHALSGKQFHDIRGPVVLVLLAAVVLITIAAFCLYAQYRVRRHARVSGMINEYRLVA